MAALYAEAVNDCCVGMVGSEMVAMGFQKLVHALVCALQAADGRDEGGGGVGGVVIWEGAENFAGIFETAVAAEDADVGGD